MTASQRTVRRAGEFAIVAAALALAAAAGAGSTQPCVGDCDGSNRVAIDELMVGVGSVLGSQAPGACPAFDCEHDGKVSIHCLLRAVRNALDGCPCPLAAGSYTLTQKPDGGSLEIYPFSPFPLPPDATLTADVGAAREPDCTHDVVVPFPGGFHVSTFCIPATGFSVGIQQTGCGVGQIDSNGGADYTVTEAGDTSDSSAVCDLPQPGCANGADGSVRVDVTVGDGIPDTCARGAANAILSVPVLTTVWIEHSSGDSCPANDGTYDAAPHPDPAADDVLVLQYRQIRDITTDTTTARWEDLDGDGCTIAGRGPASGLSSTGECLDLEAGTIGTVDAAPISTVGAPLYDATYVMRARHTISGPDVPLGATCTSPPAIDFHGTATRCIPEP